MIIEDCSRYAKKKEKRISIATSFFL